MFMSDRFLSYLKREHDRLKAAVDNVHASQGSDDAAIARLKKQKLAVKTRSPSGSATVPGRRSKAIGATAFVMNGRPAPITS